MIYGNQYLSKGIDSDVIHEDTLSSKNFNPFFTANNRSNPANIWINYESGELPHLHMSFDKKIGCIRLDVPEYFNHSNQHNLSLSNSQAKDFNTWMGKKFPGTDKTNWEMAVYFWNKSIKDKSEGYIKNITSQPNYSYLNR